MIFKIDENLPVEAAELLRRAGYDAVTVLDQHLGGSSDSTIAAVCKKEGRVLLTLDLDFADIQVYPPIEYTGIIVLRLRQQDKPYILNIIEHLIRLFPTESIERKLWIVDEKQVRIRE